MSPIPTLLFRSEILLCFRKYDQVGSVLGNHIFSENMPWEAPFVKVGKGASSGDAVDGCGEETGQGSFRENIYLFTFNLLHLLHDLNKFSS